VIHGTGLRNSAEADAWVNGGVGTELALFTLVKAGVVLPEGLVLLALRLVIEGEDGDGGHLAIARGHTEVTRNILTGALGALVDAAACTLLRRRIGIESAFTVDAFADHRNLLELVG
jgi:hypothetical protein